MKILITDSLSEEGIAKLCDEGFEVTEGKNRGEDELVRIIPEYDALIVRSETKVTETIINAASNLKIIGRAGTGLDNIDVDAATRKGIIVMNTPESNTISAAEHTVSMLLSLSRNIPQAHLSLKKGIWDRKKFMGTEIYGKTLGVIGLGRIGSQVARRAQCLGMKVMAYDPFTSRQKAEEIGVILCSLDELLSAVDYLTIHTPLTEHTKCLISEREFSLMKNGVRVINCARGGVIDEGALLRAIKTGKVKGAALDVFENGKPFGSPLLELDSVIVTPHLGASTREAQVRVAEEITTQIIDALKKGEIRNAVNIPSFPLHLKKKIGGYLSLVEKMGTLAAQLVEGNLKDVEVIYKGDLAEYEVKPLTSALIKGLLSFVLKEGVNYINAPVLAKERGIKVSEVKTTEEKEYSSVVEVRVFSDDTKLEVEGTLLEKKIPYVVRINNHYLEFIPQGHLLICRNVDKPGAVGKISSTLGEFGINIAGLHMGRAAPGEENVSVYSLDSSPTLKVIQALQDIEEVLGAKLVHL
ncbi:phosphoglycerate dehydrogenase [Candidatus Aerophobetes bacterium]|nr:phosphoglycerate dehydrogenase [Candidatus Aerophobetes bacterium]